MAGKFCIVARNNSRPPMLCVFGDQQMCREGCKVARAIRPDAVFPEGLNGDGTGPVVKWMGVKWYGKVWR